MVNRANAARRLRTELLTRGYALEEIAAEIGKRLNERPRVAWRRAMGWSQAELVEQYKTLNPGAHLSVSRVSEHETWPFGGTEPSLAYLTGLAHTFACAVNDVVDAADMEHLAPSTRRHLTQVARRPEPAVDATEAARESWLHLASAAGAVDTLAIEHVHQEVTRLAKDFHEVPAAQMLTQARAARDLTYRMLERTRRPGQQADLYLTAGIASALLSAGAFDVGQMGAAHALAKASIGYADLIDHTGLRAWSGGFLALVAYWAGRPREAIGLLDQALEHAPAGTPTARLHAIRARAWGLLGDVREVAADVARSDTAFERAAGDSELQDGIGGEFGWRTTRHELCIGAAWVAAGDPGAALPRIRGALEAPQPDPETLLEPAHVDLAAADLAAGDLDAAGDDLRMVWTMPVGERRHGLTGRFDRVRHQLTVGPWRGQGAARALEDRIEDFVSEARQHRALLTADGA